MFKPAAILFAFAAVVNILSIPNIFAEMRQFVEWLGMPAAEWHWWNYAGFFGGLFIMALAAYGMYVAWDDRPSFLRRKSREGTTHSVDAGSASHVWRVPEPSVTVKRRPSWWKAPIKRIQLVMAQRRGPQPVNVELGAVSLGPPTASARVTVVSLPKPWRNPIKWLRWKITGSTRHL